MQLSNPQAWQYEHANFNGEVLKVALNNTAIDAFLSLLVTPPGQGTATAQIQAQDNGHVRIRVVQGGPITVLVVDGTGATVFEG